MRLISIIVPVYNGESFIEKCITSLLEQSYKNIEIIVVDDGSSDNSVQIITKMMSKNSEIKLLKQKNEGVSVARNNALNIASGEFVTFVDADDYVDRNHLKNMSVEFNDQTVDAVVCGYIIESKLKESIKKNVPKKEKIIFKQYVHEILINDVVYGYIGNKMFRLDKIKSMNLYFAKDIFYAEDLLFNIEYAVKCKNIIIVPETTYHYVQHSKSATVRAQSRVDLDRALSRMTSTARIIGILSGMKIFSKEISYLKMKNYGVAANFYRLSFEFKYSKKERKVIKSNKDNYTNNYMEYFFNSKKNSSISEKAKTAMSLFIPRISTKINNLIKNRR